MELSLVPSSKRLLRLLHCGIYLRVLRTNNKSGQFTLTQFIFFPEIGSFKNLLDPLLHILTFQLNDYLANSISLNEPISSLPPFYGAPIHLNFNEFNARCVFKNSLAFQFFNFDAAAIITKDALIFNPHFQSLVPKAQKIR